MDHANAADSGCSECDQTYLLGPARAGQTLRCRRCGHHLRHVPRAPVHTPLALSLAALVFLPLLFAFPFLTIEQQGSRLSIDFFHTASSMMAGSYYLIAALVILSLMIFPLIDTLLLVLLYSQILLRRQVGNNKFWLYLHSEMKAWLMVDVFLIGILVALVKITSYADVRFGPSFAAYCAFVILYLAALACADHHYLHQALLGPNQKLLLSNGAPGQLCRQCHQLNHSEDPRCRRCHHALDQRVPASIQKTLALLVAAVVLYVPASLYPIMNTTLLGKTDPSTILGGVFLLWDLGSYPVAVVIFIASVLVPVAKMLALLWLCLAVTWAPMYCKQELTRLYRLTEFIGRWSMIDVFVVALLAALIQIQGLASITPGPAAIAFSAVVILTMLSARSFDPRLIWDQKEHNETR
ncbi:paraquat-inducible protein A [Ferrimonas pelagia]|uniref:Paraquat-inducible protein A n=1 Tax=Ferrimonas pelagia TaxID=1177826 RepID=A0ABP9EW01_9GAMM